MDLTADDAKAMKDAKEVVERILEESDDSDIEWDRKNIVILHEQLKMMYGAISMKVAQDAS